MSEEATSRNAGRTQRAILAAATVVIREQGTGVSLVVIAEAAGVSKGGLLHHFPSRDELFLAVAEDSVNQLRSRVHELVDLSENRPGKMLRAYIRAFFDGGNDVQDYFEFSGLWSMLKVIPGVAELLQEDTDWWRARFAEDGLHPDRIMLAQYATEGIIGTSYWDKALTPEVLEQAKATIFALTETNGPVAA